MPGALRELLAFFKIDVDSSQLQKADSQIESFIGKLKTAAVAGFWAEAAHKVGEFVTGQVQAAAHLQDLAERLDVSAGAIKAFGFAAQSAGIDMDTAAHALGFLQKNAGEAMHGGAEQAKAFRQLGVQLKDAHGNARPLTDLVGDLADGFKRLPDQQTRAAYAMRVFGREGRVLLPVMAQGRDAMQALFDESSELGSGLGGDFYKNAKKIREEFEHFQFALLSVKERALEAILPYLDKLGRWLIDGTKWLINFAKQTNALKTALIALATVIGVALVAAFAPILIANAPLIAAITAIYIAFDDLFTFLSGGKSVIGDVITAFFGLKKSEQASKDLNEALSATIDIVKDLGDIIVDVLLGAIEQLFDAAKGVGAALKDIATAGDFKGAMRDLGKAKDEMFSDLKKRGGDIAQQAGEVVEDVTLASSARKERGRERALRAQLGEEGYANLRATRGEVAPTPQAPGATGTREVVAIPGQGARGAHVEHHTVVHQSNRNSVTVHTGSDQPESVGKAAAGGVEKGTARANANALAALNTP